MMTLTRPELPVYGGVQNDLEFGWAIYKEIVTDDTHGDFFTRLNSYADGLVLSILVTGFVAVDLPLSFVGDTLTLPITIPKTLENPHTRSLGELMASQEKSLEKQRANSPDQVTSSPDGRK